ncbi:cholinesterase-like protein [Purpureocillium lavendulum]|uniref:Carboxylic ester hydrolase n=1 Tax=Purpureocillium lavendulum TaxID=1247861 RepID=A0AB34G0P4_9HYPO|nr:cholinesterase-like protein [Purpureocillium lavendulum]
MRVLARLSALFVAVTAIPGSPYQDLQPRADEVTVALPFGTVIGKVSGVESFNGIPYAEPPVNRSRLRPPKKLRISLGVFNATGPAAACPQMPWSPDKSTSRNLEHDVPDIKETPLFQAGEDIKGQEDCLTVTVQRPKGTQRDDMLPVIFYIFGGGFMFGATAANDAEAFIRFAESQNQPFIFVGVNYRVAGFGFMGGAEILQDGSANLGLLDQRMGLEWVADNIAFFGGNPDRVTLLGHSAGSISVFDQMALFGGDANYKGKPLFHGAIMSAGSVIPTESVDSPKAQAIYNTVVERVGCNDTDHETTLDCLRDRDFEDLYHAVNSVPRILSYSSLALSYLPRPDGRVLTHSPDVLADKGKYHAVPVIIGDQEDEGTLFSFAQRDVNNSERLIDYLTKYFFHNATKEEVTGLVSTYPVESAAGSPFRTGLYNEYYQLYFKGKGFKRMAALLGDVVFTLARRLAIEAMHNHNSTVPIWSYIGSFKYGTAYLGSSHGSDWNSLFKGNGRPAKSTRTYFLNFIHNQDPNIGVPQTHYWPKWTKIDKQLLWVKSLSNDNMTDDFRNESYAFIKGNTKALYF